MIQNKQIKVARGQRAGAESLAELITNELGDNALRWYVADANRNELSVEATIYEGGLNPPPGPPGRRYYPGKTAALNVVPTGVGCSIGGYAGDAAPTTRLLASAVDYLITNPNAVNASDFINLGENVIYTDGYCMDLLARGVADLHLPYANKVGLIVEKSDDRNLDAVFNVLNAVRAVHGVDVVDYVVTGERIGGRCVNNKSGAFVGTVDNPGVLFDACERLIAKGATAIAITSDIDDLPLEDYAKHFEGQFPNPIGGVEAIISYLVTNRYGIPSAHAPLINLKQLDLVHNVVDARGAGEIISVSGLACVLVGLRRAPQINPPANCRVADVLNINNLLAVVTPAGCLGGIPALYAQKYGIPVIAVEENRTILDVSAASLGLENVIEARSYAEAAGILLALRRGIALGSLSRPLKTYRYNEA